MPVPSSGCQRPLAVPAEAGTVDSRMGGLGNLVGSHHPHYRAPVPQHRRCD